MVQPARISRGKPSVDQLVAVASVLARDLITPNPDLAPFTCTERLSERVANRDFKMWKWLADGRQPLPDGRLRRSMSAPVIFWRQNCDG